jgi:hypothetical protein
MGSVGGDIGNFAKRVTGLEAMQHQANFFGVGLGIADPYEAKALGIDQGAFNPNAQEQAWNQMMMDRMQGRGPSVAELQMRQGLEAGNKQAMGLAASQRGVSPAQAARLASISQGQSAMQTNQQAGILRAQEQMGSAQVFGQGLQSQRAGRMAGQQLAVQQNLGIHGINLQGYEGRANRANKTIENLGAGLAQYALGMANGGLVDPSMMQSAQSNDQAFLSAFANALGQQVGAAMAMRVGQGPQTNEQSPFSMRGNLNRKLDAKANAKEMAPALADAFKAKGTEVNEVDPKLQQQQNQLPAMPNDPNAGTLMFAQQPQLQFPAGYLMQIPQQPPVMQQQPRVMMAQPQAPVQQQQPARVKSIQDLRNKMATGQDGAL